MNQLEQSFVIDDLSGRSIAIQTSSFSVVDTFTLASTRFQKYITYVRDKRYTAQRQLMLVDVVHDSAQGYLNQYARVETQYDQGSFEFGISGLMDNFFSIQQNHQ